MSQINWSQLGLGGGQELRGHITKRTSVSSLAERAGTRRLRGTVCICAYKSHQRDVRQNGRRTKESGNTSGAGRHAPADLPAVLFECLTLVLAAVVLIFLMEPLIYQLVKGVLTTTLACIRSLQCSSCQLFLVFHQSGIDAAVPEDEHRGNHQESVGEVLKMRYLVGKSVQRFWANRKRYAFVILQIMIGTSLVALALHIQFSFQEQFRAFQKEIDNQYVSVRGDNLNSKRNSHYCRLHIYERTFKPGRKWNSLL